MKAKDLIKILEKNPESELVVASDAEGNEYAPLGSAWKCVYIAETSYNGIVGYKKLTKELKECGYTEDDLVPDDVESVDAIVFSPV